jgi:hypothetical protein
MRQIMKISNEKMLSLVFGDKNGAAWTDVSLLVLIAANALPLFGVIFLKWDVFYILILYWSENLAIGFYNVLKMALVKVKNPIENLGKLFEIPFFMVHYGMFTAIHGVFIIAFFGKEHNIHFSENRETWPCFLAIIQKMLINPALDVMQVVPLHVKLAALSLFVSHGVSFVRNYLINGEYTRTNSSNLFIQPYGRVVVMHVTILIGGILLQVTGSPAALLIILIGLKVFIDVILHNAEHKKALSAESR